eukprot:TRINITY_DN10198_c0_g1_i9.p3 TRINITY_DN10198_c0_g1~~TRINITY_DN10198_c0_g1_i9.p3  ORF type:complete len:175 (-),score=51.65 TRINITY_DN10198_c0_g1_i9:1164-1688(-)
MHSLQKDQITLDGWDRARRKQLVQDPRKNELMHNFIDKYAEMVRSSLNSQAEEEKDIYNAQEETLKVLGALRATQNKQRQQRYTKCVIEDAEEFSPEPSKAKEPVHRRLKGNEKHRHSQSVVLMPLVNSGTAEQKRSRHRRTESVNFDSNSLKKIRSIDLDLVMRKNQSCGCRM